MFETVRIRFLSDVPVCYRSEILLPWQRDVTTSLLNSSKYRTWSTRLVTKNLMKNRAHHQ